MRVYTTRNWFVARSFIREVLEYCENKPKFVIDKASWLKRALECLGLKFRHERFGSRSSVKSVFSSLKQRIRIFICSITAKNPVKNWNLFCKLFILYYNQLR